MRVAMITLCVPSSESLNVIEGQLVALGNVDYPHDSWILDEGCLGRGSRARGHARGQLLQPGGGRAWNQPEPPFKAKTKAGNVNAWLDHVQTHGLDYEVFVQLDIDHARAPDYLDRVLGYFRRKVAWVQAPIVYGNLDNWAARGSAEQELSSRVRCRGFYGSPARRSSSAPTRRIGPLLSARSAAPAHARRGPPRYRRAPPHGHPGVFVPEVIATGDGPHNIETYLRSSSPGRIR